MRNARDEARQELNTELGWVRTLGDRQKIERAIALIDRLDRDASAFHRDLGSELHVDDGGVGEEELIDPEPDLIDQSGTMRTYSDKAALKIAENAAERTRRQIMQEMGPALEYIQQAQARDGATSIQTQGKQLAADAIETMKTYPHWDLKKVGAIYTKMDPQIRQRFGVVAALHMAYNKYFAEQVLPTLGTEAEQRQLADLQRSASAGAPNGTGGAPPASPQKKTIREGNVDDIAARMVEIHGHLSATP